MTQEECYHKWLSRISKAEVILWTF